VKPRSARKNCHAAVRGTAVWATAAWATAILCTPALIAQTGYKYRDANGQWVFSDRAPSATTSNSFNLEKESAGLHLSVDRDDRGGATLLVAVNDCLCVATFELSVNSSAIASIPSGSAYQATLEPGTRQTLLKAPLSGGRLNLEYAWHAAIGAPDAIHTPSRPYRVPFAVGSTFEITQAYPSRFTHVTADSEYAVDIALPDGTHVYSAREGTVINVRHDSYRGGAAAAMLDQANVVEILHSDGTIAIYAHLHWDSIRVRMGERVVRGQYIADSGNTGFSSGPHLHFAVIRNSGTTNVSLPIQFASNMGAPITPATRMSLTAY
jgi:murein DD-endopeptidase MepM/ murein hydrolase activator NlpD